MLVSRKKKKGETGDDLLHPLLLDRIYIIAIQCISLFLVYYKEEAE